MFKHCAYYGPSAKIDSAAYPQWNESRLSAPSSNNHHGRGVQHHNNAERCFKGGLTNHKTYQCYYKKQLQCYICKFYGHTVLCVGTFRTNMALILINTLYLCQKIDTILYQICGACNCMSCDINDLDSNVPSEITSFYQKKKKKKKKKQQSMTTYMIYLHFLIKVLKLIFNTQILPLIIMCINILLKTMCMTLLVFP